MDPIQFPVGETTSSTASMVSVFIGDGLAVAVAYIPAVLFVYKAIGRGEYNF